MTPKPTPPPDDNEPVDAELVGTNDVAEANANTLANAFPGSELEVVDDNHPSLVEQDAHVLDLLGVDDAWAGVGDGDTTGDGHTGRIPHMDFNRKVDGGLILPTGAKVRDADFVWLAKARSRSYWAEAYDPKNPAPPNCRSFDGRTADPQAPDVQNGGDCTTCPHAQWDGDTKPACKEAIEAMVFLADSRSEQTGKVLGGVVSRIRFHGLALSPARAYWESFTTRVPKRPPIAYLSRMTLEAQPSDYGDFLVPRFERVEEMTRGEAQPLIDERDARIKDWHADIADDVAAGAGGDGGGADPGSEARTVVSDDPDEAPF